MANSYKWCVWLPGTGVDCCLRRWICLEQVSCLCTGSGRRGKYRTRIAQEFWCLSKWAHEAALNRRAADETCREEGEVEIRPARIGRLDGFGRRGGMMFETVTDTLN